MLAAIVLGAAQGVRHSFEPDHLAAVSALIGDRPNGRRGAWLGVAWGIGHTSSLIAMCLALVAFGAAVPPEADRIFTLLVAAILIVLGIRSLWRGHHRHHNQTRQIRTPLQAFGVGTIHGLAGSSALTAIVFAALPTAMARLLYVALFGIGSIMGMAAMSSAAGLWLQQIRRPRLMLTLRLVIGVGSIVVGVVTAVRAFR
jgi:MFS family permease